MFYKSPDLLPKKFTNPSVFIAGGISNCPDWQSELCELLDSDSNDVVNPRRKGGFDRTGLTAKEQIIWEHTALSQVDACIFWFPKETLCPITLFELGKMLNRASENNMFLAVGWHPEYERAFDLEVQIGLEASAKDNVFYSGPGWDQLVKFSTRLWG